MNALDVDALLDKPVDGTLEGGRNWAYEARRLSLEELTLGERIADLRKRVSLKEAKHMADVTAATVEEGGKVKPMYGNDLQRKAEVEVRMDADQEARTYGFELEQAEWDLARVRIDRTFARDMLALVQTVRQVTVQPQ